MIKRNLIKGTLKNVPLMILLMGTAVIAKADESGLPIHGFAAIGGGFAKSTTPEDQNVRGVGIGTIDLYLNPEFEDRVKTLMEIAIEPAHKDGQVGIDSERLQVGYTLADYLTLWAGRFHTPYGYWNTAYHHGDQLQTSVYRPRFLDFEDSGGILPAHTTGIWGKGGFGVGSNKINYNLYVGNGSRIILNVDNNNNRTGGGKLDMNSFRNDKNHYMYGGSLSFAFQSGALDGLEIGAHGYQTNVNSYLTADYDGASASDSTDQVMTGGYFNYSNHNFDFIGEYYHFADKNLLVKNSSRLQSFAEFAQLSYTFPGLLTPYVRVENANFASQDNYFVDQDHGVSYKRWAVGARHDLNSKAAFKFEYQRTTDNVTANGSLKGSTIPAYDLFKYTYCIRF